MVLIQPLTFSWKDFVIIHEIKKTHMTIDK